uniref:Uncharacterized protein n=1 Tax=Alexandrium catenella TaxID=2925 RepID=A0A7S1Q5B8_ALECA|eukprot:CAMPEP_0171157966 /NCGR_PEP_ID=MMETSP0790-20130122/2247_1 /TAXON_ID=2925 /ORGANISM="Alexandrium catenella, Strain OF101" /LENGTH=131 /DNA_ID=CAMNT_0011622351 /DNA_START=53 /DNA_END=448 /DNA_ORIENTATION=+
MAESTFQLMCDLTMRKEIRSPSDEMFLPITNEQVQSVEKALRSGKLTPEQKELFDERIKKEQAQIEHLEQQKEYYGNSQDGAIVSANLEAARNCCADMMRLKKLSDEFAMYGMTREEHMMEFEEAGAGLDY